MHRSNNMLHHYNEVAFDFNHSKMKKQNSNNRAFVSFPSMNHSQEIMYAANENHTKILVHQSYLKL